MRDGDVADTDDRRLDVGLICRTGDIGDVLEGEEVAVSGLLRWVSRSGTVAEEVREWLAASIARQHMTVACKIVSRQTLWRML